MHASFQGNFVKPESESQTIQGLRKHEMMEVEALTTGSLKPDPTKLNSTGQLS